VTHLGPFELGRVHRADCLEALRELPPGSVPMFWTDPPYGCDQHGGDDLATRLPVVRGKGPETERPIRNDSAVDTERVVRGFLAEAARLLPKKGALALCCGGGGPVPMFARVVEWIEATPGLEFFHALVWDKGSLGMGWRYRRGYEFVMVAHRRGGAILWAHEGGDASTSNMRRHGRIIPTSADHPTPKPVELVEGILRLHTAPGDLVVDPFAGGGATGVACARLGRPFLGFELEERWMRLANDRIAQARDGVGGAERRTGQRSIFDLIGEEAAS